MNCSKAKSHAKRIDNLYSNRSYYISVLVFKCIQRSVIDFCSSQLRFQLFDWSNIFALCIYCKASNEMGSQTKVLSVILDSSRRVSCCNRLLFSVMLSEQGNNLVLRFLWSYLNIGLKVCATKQRAVSIGRFRLGHSFVHVCHIWGGSKTCWLIVSENVLCMFPFCENWLNNVKWSFQIKGPNVLDPFDMQWKQCISLLNLSLTFAETF